MRSARSETGVEEIAGRWRLGRGLCVCVWVAIFGCGGGLEGGTCAVALSVFLLWDMILKCDLL